MDILDKNSIEIEYMYAFVGKKDEEALVILRVEDPDKAINALTGNGVKVLTADDVYKL